MKNITNKINQFSLVIGGALLALVLFPQSGLATSLTVKSGTGEELYLKVDGSVTSAWAGSIQVNVGGGLQTVMCVDYFDSLSSNVAYTTTIGAPNQINNGGRVAWLLDYELPTLSSAAQLAGLQLAIWDIVTDNGDGFGAGRIRSASNPATDTVALGVANTMLSLSAGKSSTYANVYFNADPLSCTTIQTLMGGTVPPSTPTPEPQSFAMIGAGAIALSMLKLRRRK